eukprot:13940134-Alexandrium_andersonii.AAC.1
MDDIAIQIIAACLVAQPPTTLFLQPNRGCQSPRRSGWSTASPRKEGPFLDERDRLRSYEVLRLPP